VIEEVLPEIQRSVEAKLVRYAAVGKVVIDSLGHTISLTGTGAPVTLPIGALVVRWRELSFEERERESAHLARSLMRERRTGSPVPERSRAKFPVTALAVTGGVLLGGAALYQKIDAALAERAAAAREKVPDVVDSDAERRAHAAQVCHSTRARLSHGGTVGPADTEGWVVELSLVSPGAGPAWPSLASFIALEPGTQRGRINWKGGPELSKLEGHDTRVEVQELALPEGSPQYRQRTLTFYGAYVLPYFREREQIQMVRLAHALVATHDSTVAGMYARCSEGSEHHMGSWFVGSSPGAAASALLFFMGAYAQPAQLPREVLSSREERELEPEFALTNILNATQKLKKAELVALVGPQSGTVAGSDTASTVAFPFVESDRALVASLSLAKLLEPAAAPPTSTRHRVLPR
jgi:hypothetical protein